MNDKSLIITIAFLGLFIQFLNYKKGDVKVNPLINYNDFLKWYSNTIGDYNQDGSIPFESEYFDYWLNKKN